MENKDFVHLHLHDQYSILDGYGTAKQYCERAKELGFEAMALTNHGNVDGVIRWQNECKKNGIKNITGCEAYIVPDMRAKKEKEKRYHVTLLAKNSAGFHALLKILSAANLDGFYYRPRIDPNLLLEHCKDLVVGGACLDSYINMYDGIELLKQIGKLTETYLEVMPHAMPEQAKFNAHVLKVAKDLKVPVVATNDCHYPERKHSKLQEVMLAMQSKKRWKDKDRWRFSIDTLWMTSVGELKELFEKQGVVLGKDLSYAMMMTKEIANLCDLDIKKQQVFLPRPPVKGKDHLDEEDQLIQLTIEGFERRKRLHPWITEANQQKYVDRMNEELEIIISQGFARYFLIVWELIDWCRANDIEVGPGRGSSGGSLVAWFLNITQVDPIKYELIFSRFISEARIDLPDIDMDFEDTKRDKILQHLKDLYGEYNVIGVSTFAKLKGKGVIRKVSRVFDLPMADVNKAAECIVVRSGGDARCLAAGTELYTTKGKVAIENIKEGDKIASIQGDKIERRIVTGIFDNGETDVLEIELESGKKIICSDRHRIFVKRETGTKGWRRAKRLKEGDLLQVCDESDIYCFCKQCGKLIYKDRAKGKGCCSLSCSTTYRSLHNNPLSDPAALEKMKQSKKGKRCKWFDDPVLMAIDSERKRKRLLANNPMDNPKTREKARQSLRRVMPETNRRPERVARQREYMLDRLAKDPDSHPLRLLANNPRKGITVISHYQAILSKYVHKAAKAKRLKVVDEYPFCRSAARSGWCYLDVAVPEKKIDFEFDGGLHKKHSAKETDTARDLFLKHKGWRVIRFVVRDMNDESYKKTADEALER